MIVHFRIARRRYLAAASQEHCLIGASLFRIGAGLTILYQYLIAYYQRYFLYGPNGVVPYDWFVQQLPQTGSFSLYALDASAVVFEGVFHLGIVITILWVLGWHTRVMTLLTWVFLWSLHQRNPTLWDGGDNLIQIVLLYAVFANLGAVCSIDAAKRRPQCPRSAAAQQALAMLHMPPCWPPPSNFAWSTALPASIKSRASCGKMAPHSTTFCAWASLPGRGTAPRSTGIVS
jgi:hypothetical protein